MYIHMYTCTHNYTCTGSCMHIRICLMYIYIYIYICFIKPMYTFIHMHTDMLRFMQVN